MVTFKFTGYLQRYYGQVDLNVTTAAQGLRLLIAQNREFKKSFLSGRVSIHIDDKPVNESELSFSMDKSLPDGSVVMVSPEIEGAVTGMVVASLILAAVSVAYSIYTARNMKNQTSAEAAETDSIKNNSFSSVENRVGQGSPVPLLLGEMVCGSNVLSVGIDTSNDQDFTMLVS